MVVSLNYCSQNGGNLYRAPYYNGNPSIGPRILGNLDQSPHGIFRRITIKRAGRVTIGSSLLVSHHCLKKMKESIWIPIYFHLWSWLYPNYDHQVCQGIMRRPWYLQTLRLIISFRLLFLQVLYPNLHFNICQVSVRRTLVAQNAAPSNPK